MDRGHQPALDAERVVEHLGHRREAVGRAASVRDELVIAGQLVVVDAINDGQVDALRRRRDQHALGASRQMLARAFGIGEEARAFERDVDAERSEEHTSELQSLMRNSYAVLCLKKHKYKLSVPSSVFWNNNQT